MESDPVGFNGGSFSTYAYTNSNPLNRIDELGLWGEEAHNAIIKAMFPGLNPLLLQAIEQGSASVDTLTNQFPGTAYKHAMRAPGQSIADAQSKMCAFVNSNLAGYLAHVGAGNIREQIMAYRDLGQALHPIMDSTSPAHAGWQIRENPLFNWNEWWPGTTVHGDRSSSIENIGALTPALLQETLNRMRTAMAGKCGCAQ